LPRRLGGLLRTLLLAVSLFPILAAGESGTGPPAEVQTGQRLPEALLPGLNGPSRKWSGFRGQALVINVWASWCGPCRQEMASLERLAWQQHAVPFAVIGISTDDDPESARRLLESTNATISHFIDEKLRLETLLGASRLPLTVLVDAQGQVIDKIYGAKEWDGPEARRVIERSFRNRSSASKP
jgi:thiol-disulfide isomerase/thioredoxin